MNNERNTANEENCHHSYGTVGCNCDSFHSLRHSSISYKLVLTGGNIKAVQGDSGHAQAEMITERYGHIIDTCRKQCAEDFEEEFYKGM